MSIPTVANKRPMLPESKPFIQLPFARVPIKVRPNIAKVKNSGGPKSKATLERGGAINNKAIVLKIPPIKEATKENPIAFPPSPFCAIG